MQARPCLSLAVLVSVVTMAAGCSTTTTAPRSSVGTTSPRPTSPVTASAWAVARGADSVPGWLDGVDCVSSTTCVAVGNELTATGPPGRALVDTWRQGRWSSVLAPPATGSNGDYLFSVSCPSLATCVAVGYFFARTNSGGNGHMLIETLANGSWAVTRTPVLDPAVSASFLNGVSCPTPTTCVAVGSTSEGDTSTNQPLILTLTGGSWSVTAGPVLGPVGGLLSSGALEAVSCPDAATCTATGYRSTNDATRTLAESLSGGRWSVVSTPGSGGASLENGAWGLNGLSCAAVTSCVAVGQFTNGGPVVDTMTGGRWSATSIPKVAARDGDSGLYSVSCTTTTCVAVGDLAASLSQSAGDGALGLPLGPVIDTDSGGQWRRTAGPSSLPADSGLHAVSCAGRTCVAVGQSGQFTAPTSVSKTLIIQTS